MSPSFTSLVIYPYINFFIFAAIVVFVARKPLKEYFSNLFNKFSKDTKDAQSAFDEAKKTHEQAMARMENLDKEIEEMKQAAERSSQIEVDKIKKHAEDLSIHLSKETKRIAEAEMNQATASLREEMIKSVMTKIESTIEQKVGSNEQAGVLKSAIEDFKNLKSDQRI